MLVAAMPWLLVRSVAQTILLAPLLLLIAGIAVAASTIAIRGGHVLPAGAEVAGTYTALSCLGPRSRAPRRELKHAFNAIASGRGPAAMATLMLGALAVAIVFLAVVKPPALWPVPGLHSVPIHLSGIDPAHAGTRG